MKQPVMKVKAMELKSVALCQTALQQMKQACASRNDAISSKFSPWSQNA